MKEEIQKLILEHQKQKSSSHLSIDSISLENGAEEDKVHYVYVKATNNNTFVSLYNLKGDMKIWSSTGKLGFKGSKRSTGYAAQVTGIDLADRASQRGYKSIVVFLNGFGSGRLNALKGLSSGGLTVEGLVDVTPKAHNGCRPPKIRKL